MAQQSPVAVGRPIVVVVQARFSSRTAAVCVDGTDVEIVGGIVGVSDDIVVVLSDEKLVASRWDAKEFGRVGLIDWVIFKSDFKCARTGIDNTIKVVMPVLGDIPWETSVGKVVLVGIVCPVAIIRARWFGLDRDVCQLN